MAARGGGMEKGKIALKTGLKPLNFRGGDLSIPLLQILTRDVEGNYTSKDTVQLYSNYNNSL